MSTSEPLTARIAQYVDAKSDGWHLSLARILWCYFHLEFCGFILKWTVAEWYLPTLPYPGLLSLFSLIPKHALLIIAIIHLCTAVMILLGWHTRFFQWVIVGTSITLFFRSASLYHNHHAFYLFVTFFFAFLSTERYYSLDARRKKRSAPERFSAWQSTMISLFPQRLIQLQLSMLYFFAALNKLDPAWFKRWSTTPELIALSPSPMFATFWRFLLEHNIAWIPLVLIIGLLFFLSVGIFLPHHWPVIAMIGIGMHLTFTFSLHIIEFTRLCTVIWLMALFPARHPLIQEFAKFCRNTFTRFTGIR